jgi:hypothetical protein
MYYVARNRRTFSASQGCTCLGPKHMKDELVVIFLSVRVPYILRKFDTEYYQLISEAYFHGIMNGKFMRNKSVAEIFDII